MGMLLHRRGASTDSKKQTKAADVTPVVEKKSKKEKAKDEEKSEK